MSAVEVQLHHMARRHHASMKKLDALRDRIANFSTRTTGFAPVGTFETGAGAWVGGLMDGKLHWPVSMSLVFGGGLILLDWLDFAGERDRVHYGNVGKGFLSGALARAGYRFGQRWRARSAQPQGAS